MIYRSNLTAPDLQPYFRYTTSRVKPYSQGHDIISDFADKADDDPVFAVYKQCGFFTHDEAAILYNIAKQIGGVWLDIGGLTGWTAAHLAAAGCEVLSIDPMYSNRDFLARTHENLGGGHVGWYADTSNAFFAGSGGKFNGIVIDGDHESPRPLQDAINAAERISPGGVIVLHDLIFAGPQEALRYLFEHGWKMRTYITPHRLTVCHRDGFVPPEHVPDPELR